MCPEDKITGLDTPTWWAKLIVKKSVWLYKQRFHMHCIDRPHQRILLHLVPRIRMSGAIPLLLYMPSWRGDGKTFSGS